MKRANLVRFICFIVVLALAAGSLSFIYVARDNNPVPFFAGYYTNYPFYNEPSGDIDVLIFGTSVFAASILPAVLWDEAGISSYNLAHAYLPDEVAYYWLKEALEYQSPSVVVFFGQWLFREYGDISINTNWFRWPLNDMRLSMNKVNSLNEMLSNHEEGDLLSWMFPLLHYHNRQNLGESAFDLSILYKRSPTMGAWYWMFPGFEFTLGNDFRDENREARFDVSPGYLEKMISYCKERDIEVVIVEPPTVSTERWSPAKHAVMNDYANAHGVKLIDYNLIQHAENSGFDESKHYTDMNHHNLLGATVISRYLAQYLSSNYSINDRRKESYDPHWDEVVNFYYECYNRFDLHIQLRDVKLFADYLSLVQDFYSDSYIFISATGDFAKYLTREDREALRDFGLSDDYVSKLAGNYIAVMDDGNLIIEKLSGGGVKYDGYLAPYDFTVTANTATTRYDVGPDATTHTSSIVRRGQGEKAASPNSKGINIVVYDKLNDRYISHAFWDSEYVNIISDGLWDRAFAEMDASSRLYQEMEALDRVKQSKDLLTYAEALESINQDLVIITSVKDEASNLMPAINDHLGSLGITADFTDKFRYSYIGVYDTSSGFSYEEITPEWLTKNFRSILPENIEVTSAGANVGLLASIQIDGVEYAKNERGLNIVIYDKTLGLVFDSFWVDTYEDDTYAIQR